MSVGSSDDLVLSDNMVCRRHPHPVSTEVCLCPRWCVRCRGSLIRYLGNYTFTAGPVPELIVLLWTRGDRR